MAEQKAGGTFYKDRAGAHLRGCYRRAMAVLLGALLALAPLAIAPGYFFYFDVTPKIVAIAAGGIGALWLGRGSPRPAGRFAALAALQWITLAAATALSLSPALSLGGSNWRRMGLITWTALLIVAWASARLDAGSRLHALRWMAAAGLIAAAYGILQYFGVDPVLPARAYHVGEGEWTIVRPPGPLGYATYFANWLLGAVFAALAVAAADARRGWRAAGFTAAALGAVAIVWSGTRGAMLGLAAGAVFWLAAGRRPSARWWKRTAALAAVAALAAGLFYYSPAGLKLRARARWYREDPLGGPRLILWKDGLRLCAAHAWTGAGPETFATVFPLFQSAQLSARYPDFYHESPHNMFLDALASQGVPGLAVLAAVVVLGLGPLVRRGGVQPVTAALGGGLAAMTVAHQFACFVAPTALVFWVTASWLIVTPAMPAAARPRKIPRPLRSAAAVVLSAILAWFCAGLWKADRALARSRKALDAGDLREAAREYRASLGWAPPGFSADLWYSRSMARAARQVPDLPLRLMAWQEALDAGARATTTAEDRQNAWYSLAMLRAAQNDAAGTERALRAAMAAAPTWLKPQQALHKLQRANIHGGAMQK